LASVKFATEQSYTMFPEILRASPYFLVLETRVSLRGTATRGRRKKTFGAAP